MTDSPSQFDRLVDGYYREWWRLSPSAGSRAGLYEFDHLLEAPGSEWIEQRRRQIGDAQRALRSIPIPPDGTGAALDRRVFESHLSTAQLRLDQLLHWRKDPSSPITEAIDSLFELMMRRDLEKLETAQAIVARLEKMPAYLRATCERIDEPVALWTTIAEQTLPGGVEFVRETARELSSRHGKLSSPLESAAAGACDALNDYGHWLTGLRQSRLSDDVAAGPAVMKSLVREWHGLESGLEDIEKLGWSLVEFFRDELEQHARRIDAKATWQQIMERARESFVAQEVRHAGKKSPSFMLQQYRQVTGALRERMIQDGLLELPPGESCKVISSPAFLRALLPTAAYTSPGPLDPRQIGVFFVSDPDPKLAPDAYRANVAQHYGVEETCVHEAYPGHHVQLCWANRAGSLVRQMADHIIFMEGWTLYCEQWMIEAGWFPDPALKINYLVGQLWRAYRMIIDVGVHTRKMSVEQAVQMLMEGVGFTRERAQTELNWYSQSPGVPLSYMMGKRQTLELRDAFLKGRPPKTGEKQAKPSLKDFHSWLLQFGSVPQRWLWSHLPSGN